MSETTKRIISGFSIAIVVVIALYFHEAFGSLHVFLIICLFSLLGVEEFYRLTDRGIDGKPMRGIGFAFTIVFLAIFYLNYLADHQAWGGLASFLDVFAKIENPILPALVLFLIVTSSYAMVYRPLDGIAYSITSTIVGPMYAAVPLGLVILMLGMAEGPFVFLYLAMGTIMTDVGAYFAGRWFGKHNAGLKVSPKKTYEGYIGGIIFANLMVQGFVYFWIQFFPNTVSGFVPGWFESVVLTFIISIISVFGDLVESALKRDARIKDSSSTIPGHGGVLDLVDALLFTLPIGFYYFSIRVMIAG